MFEEHAAGGPISAVSRWTPRTLEAYLKGGGRPRWMERISEIEAAKATARGRLRRARRAPEAECAPLRSASSSPERPGTAAG